MGFNDTATYLRTNQPAAVQAALTPILARYGYKPTRHVSCMVVPLRIPTQFGQ